ncbi:ubiquitin-specific protease doa4 [Rhizina undulata]
MNSNLPLPTAPPSKPKNHYPHIEDLIARTNVLKPTDRASIKTWLIKAHEHWNQTKIYKTVNRLDLAYVDYLLAWTIVGDIIPRFPEYPTFKAKGGSSYKEYCDLRKAILVQDQEFAKVRDEIKKNNALSGVISAQAQLNAQNQTMVSDSAPPPTNGHPAGPQNGSFVQQKIKPEVRPKPEFISRLNCPSETSGRRDLGLNNMATSSRSEERVAAMSAAPTPSPSLGPDSPFDNIGPNSAISSRTSSLKTQASIVSTAPSSISGSSITYRNTPMGPREMPIKPPQLDISRLPQLPAPTYSPATSYQSPVGMEPPRSIPRSSLQRSNSSMSFEADEPPLPKKPTFPNEMTLSRESLYSYLSRKDEITVLLLDVRPRDNFDVGHIDAPAIICIEPIILRDGMSGQDLEDTFVVGSSKKEEQLFSNRHKFDLVVYYDQSTANSKFLEGSTTDEHLRALRSLNQAMTDFAFEKQLKRPPYLLMGGLDAYVELVGEQALKSTSDSEYNARNSQLSRQSSPLQPQPENANGIKRKSVPERAPTPNLAQRRFEKETHRGSLPAILIAGYGRKEQTVPVTPIDTKEEEEWMQRVKLDRDPLTINVPHYGENRNSEWRSDMGIENQDHYRSIEEFFQRYPAIPPEPQSMGNLNVPGSDNIPPYPITPLPTTTSYLAAPNTPALFRQNTIIDHPFCGFTPVKNQRFNPPASPVRPAPAAYRASHRGVSERSVHNSLPPARPPKIPIMGLAAGNHSVEMLGRAGPRAGFGFGTTSHISSTGFGRTGLKNLGNTCYMNSIIQCLNGTTPLARYFLDGSYKAHLNKQNPLGSRGVLAETFASLIKHLWKGDWSFLSPNLLKDVSGRLNEMFKTDDQQDAQEYLQFLLDALHEDLNPNASNSKLPTLTEQEEARRERMPIYEASGIEWKRYTHTNYSVVVNYFQGQLLSRLTCLTCGTTSTTYSPFMYLSLPIPSGRRKVDIEDCLREFVKEEVLDGDDAWSCPKCRKRRRATKRLMITRLPMLLIVCFKRFVNKGRWRDKLNTLVEFPIEGMDLGMYLPRVPGVPGTMGMYTVAVGDEDGRVPFNLYAVCNHYGTLNGGHYTAFVKNGNKGCWTLFDDSKVNIVGEEEVVSKSAYLTFWVRSNVL